MNEWRDKAWLGRHAVAAPFGIFAAAALLAYASGGWAGWDTLRPLTAMVDLAAVIYAMLAVAFERGVNMIWWAIEQKRKREQKTNNQIRSDMLASMLAAGIVKNDQELEEWAKKERMPLDKVLERQ